MIRSLYTAATGMKANQLYVDNIANNLANVNTTAYKKSKLEFEDLLYQTLITPGTGGAEGARNPAGLQVGVGVRAISNQKIFSQGNISETQNPLDLAIAGDGFFQIMLPNGQMAYSRDGSFKIASDGVIVTSQGYFVEPQIVVPDGARELTVDEHGRFYAVLDDGQVNEEIGQVELARFMNPSGLKSLGNNLYMETDSSGAPAFDTPGENGMGAVRSGFLESSNVQLVEEMVNMIVAQRAYEISTKAIQTSEEMLQMANQLKR